MRARGRLMMSDQDAQEPNHTPLLPTPSSEPPEPRPIDYLTAPQLVRCYALSEARYALTYARTGIAGRAENPIPGGWPALINVARWIELGEAPWDSRRYPFIDHDVTVLGPGTTLSDKGEVINHNGVNYYRDPEWDSDPVDAVIEGDPDPDRLEPPEAEAEARQWVESAYPRSVSPF